MRVALKTLGYNDCYHGYSCVHENPPDNYLWLEAIDAKFNGKGEPYTKQQWDALLGDCQAVTDLPCVAFAPELIAAYPDAKVILSLPPQGIDGWYDSTVKTIVALEEDWKRDAWAFFNHEAYITRHTFFRAFDAFWEGDFRRNGKRRMMEHNQMIRDLVPAERLIEYSVTEEWSVCILNAGK